MHCTTMTVKQCHTSSLYLCAYLYSSSKAALALNSAIWIWKRQTIYILHAPLLQASLLFLQSYISLFQRPAAHLKIQQNRITEKGKHEHTHTHTISSNLTATVTRNFTQFCCVFFADWVGVAGGGGEGGGSTFHFLHWSATQTFTVAIHHHSRPTYH